MPPTRLHRPYAGKGTPSITEVLNALAVENLTHAAARETAIRAITRPEEYAGMGQAEAINRLARHHEVLWSGAASMGSLIHSVNERWVDGLEADIDELIAAQGVKAWEGREDLVANDAARYVDGLERFWLEQQPETVTAEQVVRYQRGDKAIYVGTLDWVVRINGRRLLVEIKTSSKVPKKPGDRLWLDHWRLQLAAQRHATHIVSYAEDGTETGSRPNDMTVDGCAVLHLCGDGDYGFWEVRAAGDEHGHFMRLVAVHHWWSSLHKTPKPIDLKAQTKEEAA